GPPPEDPHREPLSALSRLQPGWAMVGDRELAERGGQGLGRAVGEAGPRSGLRQTRGASGLAGLQPGRPMVGDRRLRGIPLLGSRMVAEEARPPPREGRENYRVDRLLPRWPDAGRPSQHERSALGGSRDRAPLRPLARRWSSLLLQPRRQPPRDLRGTRRGLPGLGPAADPPA